MHLVEFKNVNSDKKVLCTKICIFFDPHRGYALLNLLLAKTLRTEGENSLKCDKATKYEWNHAEGGGAVASRTMHPVC